MFHLWQARLDTSGAGGCRRRSTAATVARRPPPAGARGPSEHRTPPLCRLRTIASSCQCSRYVRNVPCRFGHSAGAHTLWAIEDRPRLTVAPQPCSSPAESMLLPVPRGCGQTITERTPLTSTGECRDRSRATGGVLTSVHGSASRRQRGNHGRDNCGLAGDEEREPPLLNEHESGQRYAYGTQMQYPGRQSDQEDQGMLRCTSRLRTTASSGRRSRYRRSEKSMLQVWGWLNLGHMGIRQGSRLPHHRAGDEDHEQLQVEQLQPEWGRGAAREERQRGRQHHERQEQDVQRRDAARHRPPPPSESAQSLVTLGQCWFCMTCPRCCMSSAGGWEAAL